MKQDVKNASRLEHYRELLAMRLMRKTFDALCVYRNKFAKAKNYWTIVLTKMDLWMKKKAFLRW